MNEIINQVINNSIAIIFHVGLCYMSLLKPKVFVTRLFKRTDRKLIALSYIIGVFSLISLINIAYTIFKREPLLRFPFNVFLQLLESPC